MDLFTYWCEFAHAAERYRTLSATCRAWQALIGNPIREFRVELEQRTAGKDLATQLSLLGELEDLALNLRGLRRRRRKPWAFEIHETLRASWGHNRNTVHLRFEEGVLSLAEVHVNGFAGTAYDNSCFIAARATDELAAQLDIPPGWSKVFDQGSIDGHTGQSVRPPRLCYRFFELLDQALRTRGVGAHDLLVFVKFALRGAPYSASPCAARVFPAGFVPRGTELSGPMPCEMTDDDVKWTRCLSRLINVDADSRTFDRLADAVVVELQTYRAKLVQPNLVEYIGGGLPALTLLEPAHRAIVNNEVEARVIVASETHVYMLTMNQEDYLPHSGHMSCHFSSRARGSAVFTTLFDTELRRRGQTERSQDPPWHRHVTDDDHHRHAPDFPRQGTTPDADRSFYESCRAACLAFLLRTPCTPGAPPEWWSWVKA